MLVLVMLGYVSLLGSIVELIIVLFIVFVVIENIVFKDV